MVSCNVSCWAQLVSVFLRNVEFSQMVIYRLLCMLDGLKKQMSKACIDRSDSLIFNINAVHVLQNTKKYTLGSHTRLLNFISAPLKAKHSIGQL